MEQQDRNSIQDNYDACELWEQTAQDQGLLDEGTLQDALGQGGIPNARSGFYDNNPDFMIYPNRYAQRTYRITKPIGIECKGHHRDYSISIGQITGRENKSGGYKGGVLPKFEHGEWGLKLLTYVGTLPQIEPDALKLLNAEHIQAMTLGQTIQLLRMILGFDALELFARMTVPLPVTTVIDCSTTTTANCERLRVDHVECVASKSVSSLVGTKSLVDYLNDD